MQALLQTAPAHPAVSPGDRSPRSLGCSRAMRRVSVAHRALRRRSDRYRRVGRRLGSARHGFVLHFAESAFPANHGCVRGRNEKHAQSKRGSCQRRGLRSGARYPGVGGGLLRCDGKGCDNSHLLGKRHRPRRAEGCAGWMFRVLHLVGRG